MRFSYRAAGPFAAAAVLTVLAGCSRVQQDWQVAQQAGTPQAYGSFVAQHPDSELAGIARQRIAQLTEEAAWHQAVRMNTAAAYQEYLTRYPAGTWSQDARIRMESRSMAAATGPGAPVTSPGPTRSAGYAVQLGAFSSAANADTAWKQLSSRSAAELQGLTPQVVPVVSAGRSLYRLQVRVASQVAAHQLCHQLQQHSQACLPLP